MAISRNRFGPKNSKQETTDHVSELGETVVDFLDVAKLSMRICKDSPVVGLSSCHGDSSICAHLNDSKNSSVVDAGSRIVRTSFSGNALTVTFEGKDRCVESDSFGVVHDSRKNFSTVVVFECEEVVTRTNILIH
ncbi:hypothetical protein AAG570_002654 [Ranatra chinensis]|uniref:Uncharacterized protein n=1 Tax=Ranatra chinensis TaxID=642074 RepID=A0ABD0YUW1_9HEMI